jgi:hypothetical protein
LIELAAVRQVLGEPPENILRAGTAVEADDSDDLGRLS